MDTGVGQAGIGEQLQGQIYLCSDAFVDNLLALANERPVSAEIPRQQIRVAQKRLDDYLIEYADDQ